MKISTDSWHYKLVDYFNEGMLFKKYSICIYFRKLMLSFLWSFLMILGSIGSLFLMIAPLFYYSGEPLTSLIPALIYIFIAIGMYHDSDKIFESEWANIVLFEFNKKEKVNKEPNLVVAFIKAKHSKFCTLIDFE